MMTFWELKRGDLLVTWRVCVLFVDKGGAGGGRRKVVGRRLFVGQRLRRCGGGGR